MTVKKKVLVIGGGAAGVMAAITASKNGCDVAILERNEKLMRKVMITGKGRCNITNDSDLDGLIKNVAVNGRFLFSAFSQFSSADMMDMLKDNGLDIKVERGNRVFPVSDKASSVVDCLTKMLEYSGVRVINKRVTSLIVEDNIVYGVVDESGNNHYCDSVIIATGGKSYSGTGSTGDGYKLAKQCGHTVVPTVPSLIPLTSSDKCCKDMQGLSLKNISVALTEKGKDKPVFKDFGEMLFTHFGVSGPVVLSASSHMKKSGNVLYNLNIDLKPALSYEQLDARLQREFSANINKDYINFLRTLLPAKMTSVFARKTQIPFDLKVNLITKEMRHTIISLLKNFSIPISGYRPIEEAIITSGGISTKEINPKTMQSKLIEGLFFCGEVIDVDAYTGGFNLQIAWSTGYLAGLNC